MQVLISELSSKSMMYGYALTSKYKGPSRNDCLAIALARQENCPLLSGDMNLRKAAQKENVVIRGTLWIVGEMVKNGILTVGQAQAAYEKMRANGRRLPWPEVLKQLENLT